LNLSQFRRGKMWQFRNDFGGTHPVDDSMDSEG
jgi:hypothetical protein